MGDSNRLVGSTTSNLLTRHRTVRKHQIPWSGVTGFPVSVAPIQRPAAPGSTPARRPDLATGDRGAYGCVMKKTFGSTLALIIVALFTVALTSPVTAAPGSIHIHLAGKVGQKAAGSQITLGAEGLTEAPQHLEQAGNACAWLRQSDEPNGTPNAGLSPRVKGWNDSCNTIVTISEDGVNIQIPASGDYAHQIPLPDLPAGNYAIWFAALASIEASGTSLARGVAFTIGTDGTFTKIGTACDGDKIDGRCMPLPPLHLPVPH